VIASAGFLVAAKSQAASWVVPEALMTRTVAAAVSGSVNSYASAVSPHVVSLVKGAMHAMLLTRLKFALAIAIAVGGAGTGLVSFHALNAGSPPSRQKPAQASVLRATDDAKDDSRDGEEEPNRNAAGDRRRSQNNLRQIGLAFHAYHDVHNHFPAWAIYDKNGKALLSWRVALLPYLAEEELYKEFKLDEPWDSTHNKKLLQKMPAVFKAPGIKTKEPHTTYYQVPVGKGAMFDGETQVTLANVTDGLSNTMLAVEGGKPVPWTKPQDLTYDPDKALPKFGGVFSDGFNVLLADGAVLFVRKNTAEKNIRAAITRAGGEKERIGD
jgi:hypothetical protein